MFILCSVTMFNLHQQIILIDVEAGTAKTIAISNLNDLSEDIVTMCEKYNISRVKIKGSKDYISGLVEDIYTMAKTNYELNNIEIEVI